MKDQATKSELNRYLQELSKKDLEKEIKKLYTKFSSVKEFYEMEFCTDTSLILGKYKEQIRREYFPTSGQGRANNKESQKVITQFKKIAIFQKDIIELTFYRCAMIAKFMDSYGGINDAFCNVIIRAFKDAAKMAAAEKLEREFKVQVEEIMNLTYNSGADLHRALIQLYQEYLS